MNAKALPTKWCIEVTEENYPYLNEWRLKHSTAYKDPNCMEVGHTLVSYHPDGSNYYSNNLDTTLNSSEFSDFTSIDFQTFMKISGFDKTHIKINKQEFIKGYKLACSEWREKLVDKYSKLFIFSDEIYVEIDFIENELKPAASRYNQKEFINELLMKKISKEVIYSTDLGVGEYGKIIEENSSYQNHIILRTYDGFVSITSPNLTWNEGAKFIIDRVTVINTVQEN